MSKVDVAGCGALNVDKIFKVPRIAKENEESFILGEYKAAGGSAANTIVALSRLGLRVGYIGKLGNDREGKFYLNELKKERVNKRAVKVSQQGKTGKVLAFVDDKGERGMYVAPGVNDELKENEAIEGVKKLNPTILHLTSFVGEKPLKAQIMVVKKFPKIKISFDPGDLYVKKGLETLKPILKRSEVVFLNEKELRELSKEKSYQEGAKKILKLGPEMIVAKRGNKGCYILSEEEEWKVKPYQGKVKDTTGAGDAFNAGFLYGMIKEKSLRECGKLGNLIASRCLEKYGARKGLPTLRNLRGKGLG